jgi:hypothetical protein
MLPGLAEAGERVRLATCLDDLMKNQRACVRVHITERLVGTGTCSTTSKRRRWLQQPS